MKVLAACIEPPGQDTEALIASCDARLARYQATLDAGADPKAVAEWTRQVRCQEMCPSLSVMA